MKRTILLTMALCLAAGLTACGKPSEMAQTEQTIQSSFETQENREPQENGENREYRENEERDPGRLEEVFFSALAANPEDWFNRENTRTVMTDLDNDGLPELFSFQESDTAEVTLFCPDEKNGYSSIHYRGDYWIPLKQLFGGDVPACRDEKEGIVCRLEDYRIDAGTGEHTLTLYDLRLTEGGLLRKTAGKGTISISAGEDEIQCEYLDGEGKPIPAAAFREIAEKSDIFLTVPIIDIESAADGGSEEELVGILRECRNKLRIYERPSSDTPLYLGAEKNILDGGADEGVPAVLSWEKPVLPADAAAEFSAAVMKLSEELEEEAGEMFSGLKAERESVDYPTGTWTGESTLHPRRMDGEALSVLIETAEEKDLAREVSYLAENIDVSSGEKIVLEDIFRDVELLPSLLAEEAGRLYPEETGAAELFAEAEPADLLWTVDPDGVSFFRDGWGVKLTPAGWPAVFTGKIRFHGADMFISLCAGLTEAIKGEDQGMRTLMFALDRDNAGAVRSIRIETGGQFYHGELFARKVSAELVCGGGGKTFLYVECTQEKEYKTLYLYDLSENTPQMLSIETGIGFPERPTSLTGAEDGEAVIRSLPLSAGAFLLEKRGSNEEIYRVNDVGLPELSNGNR